MKATRIYSSQRSVSKNPRGLEYYADMTGKFFLSSEFNATIFTVKEIKKSPNKYRFILKRKRKNKTFKTIAWKLPVSFFLSSYLSFFLSFFLSLTSFCLLAVDVEVSVKPDHTQ
jgi:hypothetical protein